MSSPSSPNPFTSHPHAVGESYIQHFGVALKYSARFFAAGFCALVHAFLPFMFEKTASTMMRNMVAEMNARTHAPHASTATQPAE